MRLEEDSPLWEKEIALLKSLLTTLPNICSNHKAVILQLFIADHGAIPDRFGKEIRELFYERMD